jgi:propionate CoA-transferase
VHSHADIERIRLAVDRCLDAVGRKVYGVVNYDRFTLAPELADDYVKMVKGLMERHYLDVTRYTSSAFLRLKLGEAMARRDLAPRLFASAVDAQRDLESLRHAPK